MDFEDSTAAEPPDRSSGVADAASPGSHRRQLQQQHRNNPGDVSIDIIDDAAPAIPSHAAYLHSNLRRIANSLQLAGEIRIRIVSDTEMSRAHQQHLGDPTTTDVITFDLADGESACTRILDVDLLICADEAVRQAADRNIPVERELLLYAVHGLLHCIGYDDHTDNDAQTMHQLEDTLLESIGVGATYNTAPDQSHARHNGAGVNTPLRITPAAQGETH